MTLPAALLLLGAVVAIAAPRLLARVDWTDREPVIALWAWQCVVAAVLLCCALSMTLSAAAAWHEVGGPVFATAPRAVVEAYAPGSAGGAAAATATALACGGLWTAATWAREVLGARARRRLRRAELRDLAPLLPGEVPGPERLVVVESERADVSWLPGAPPQLVVTTAALRRLEGPRLDAVLAHEHGHARARHDWLLHCSAALAEGFPQVPVFAAFRDEMHRLVELAADDVASRRFGRLTTARALVELNRDRGVFGPCPSTGAQVPQRVRRLLTAQDRLSSGRRLRLTAAASLIPVVPVLVALIPGLRALSG
ncbi:M56 family metallopeptidase [Streptomyces sp. HSG2]|uniref:M56 family metallopeptidase n=1 Tax=Streptomyces sp. HSG2 TaxID=2797167 RepID=UPI001907E8A1|nr:M56 family metallopeptidase [Streptomyces sp. HSG2]